MKSEEQTIQAFMVVPDFGRNRSSEEWQLEKLGIRPLSPPASHLPSSSAISLIPLVAQLVGRPIRRWAIEDGWEAGRVVAIRVTPEGSDAQASNLSTEYPSPLCTPSRPGQSGEQAAEVVIPVPIYNFRRPYANGFVRVMRAWSSHLLDWTPMVEQRQWYHDGERLLFGVLAESTSLIGWSDEDQAAVKRVLWHTLAMPRVYS